MWQVFIGSPFSYFLSFSNWYVSSVRKYINKKIKLMVKEKKILKSPFPSHLSSLDSSMYNLLAFFQAIVLRQTLEMDQIQSSQLCCLIEATSIILTRALIEALKKISLGLALYFFGSSLSQTGSSNCLSCLGQLETLIKYSPYWF